MGISPDTPQRRPNPRFLTGKSAVASFGDTMDERFCKLCQQYVNIDELQIVTESNRVIVAYDKARGIVHDLLSARATKTKRESEQS
jgi:hypothetical protein